MLIRRALLLCLITLSLALTGPFARGLSARAALDPAVVAMTAAGAVNAVTTASKNCQRGAMAWTSCSTDLGYVPELGDIATSDAGVSFWRNHILASNELRDSRLFRPPRLS